MERFLSQPFLVAEVFTGKPGEITPLADTIRSFEEIADGKWDHLPEQAFMYVGADRAGRRAGQEDGCEGVNSGWLQHKPSPRGSRGALGSRCSASSSLLKRPPSSKQADFVALPLYRRRDRHRARHIAR